MPHVIEKATSSRAKCRGCGGKIASGELRFGERLPNPFADDEAEMTHWFHVPCAAYTRPEPFLETIATSTETVADREALEHEAKLGAEHRRLPRVRAAARAATARAACRQCKEPIAKDAWRIALVYYEDGRFVPSGFIHGTCAAIYLETTDLAGRLKYFSPALSDEDLGAVLEEVGRL